MLTDNEIFQAMEAAPLSGGPGSFVLAIGRAIEAKVLEKLPRAELQRAAAYLVSNNDRDSCMTGAEADRIASVLRELAK